MAFSHRVPPFWPLLNLNVLDVMTPAGQPTISLSAASPLQAKPQCFLLGLAAAVGAKNAKPHAGGCTAKQDPTLYSPTSPHAPQPQTIVSNYLGCRTPVIVNYNQLILRESGNEKIPDARV